MNYLNLNNVIRIEELSANTGIARLSTLTTRTARGLALGSLTMLENEGLEELDEFLKVWIRSQ